MVCLVFVVGIISGFTYISGAIGVLVCAVAILILSIYLFSGDDQKDLKSKSLWLLASGLFSVAVQIYFAFLKARGTHTGVPLALPSDLEFWLFYMGKIGRSLLLSPMHIISSGLMPKLSASLFTACHLLTPGSISSR